jgi:hypothetical protein
VSSTIRSARKSLTTRGTDVDRAAVAEAGLAETPKPGGVSKGRDGAKKAVESGVKGDLAEYRHAQEVSQKLGVKAVAREMKDLDAATRTRLANRIDQVNNRQLKLGDIADDLPAEGVRQVELRVPRESSVGPGHGKADVTSRHVDHMYKDGKKVVLRESKDVAKLDIDRSDKLRQQIDGDLWIARENPGVVVEWRIDGALTEAAKTTFKQLMKENKGLFRVVPPSVFK